MVPAFEMGPSFNYSTYVLFDSIMWRASSGQINRWRKKHLHLPATDQSTLSVSKVPFLYNFSSAVVPKPLDWNDDITITGYWNLENSDAEWTPPESLEKFMAKAKADKRPLVYIGFGSIVVPKPNAMTKSIIAAVAKCESEASSLLRSSCLADVRAIIAKGWSSRGAEAEEGGEIEFPENCYSVEKVPHGWLFPRSESIFPVANNFS
jgi:sterol 3beta-glucosyltransferase